MNHYLRSKITQRGNRNEETTCIDSRDRKIWKEEGGRKEKGKFAGILSEGLRNTPATVQ